jgi:hypothetical protein
MPTAKEIAMQLIELTQDGHIDWLARSYDVASSPTGWRATHGNCRFNLFRNENTRLDVLPPGRNGWTTLHDDEFGVLLNEVAVKFGNQKELEDTLAMILNCLKPEH